MKLNTKFSYLSRTNLKIPKKDFVVFISCADHLCYNVNPCSLPKKGFDSFFYSQIKTFHGTILRARYQPHGFCHMKAYFIHSPFVIYKYMILF